MQVADPDGQRSAPAPAVLDDVPAVDIDAPCLSRNVSAANATHPDPAPPATVAGSDDYRTPNTPGSHRIVAQHTTAADGTPSRSDTADLSDAHTPRVSTGTPISYQPTPVAPNADVRSRRSLDDQLPGGPSGSMQECQPDTHITLAELTTWFKEVEHLQTGPNADATTTLKSLQSIRQGIEAFGHLLGLEGPRHSPREKATTGHPRLQTRCLLWIPFMPPVLLPPVPAASLANANKKRCK